MAATVRVELSQLGPSTSEGVVRGKHRVLVDRPVEKGGEDRGAMGGELLLVALGGCFLSNLLAAIRAREAPIQEVRVVEGTLAEAPLPPGPHGGPGQDRGQGPSGEARGHGGAGLHRGQHPAGGRGPRGPGGLT